MLTCSECRATLWPPERPRLAEGEVGEAREHVATCAECRAYFEQDAQLLGVYRGLRTQRAPRHQRLVAKRRQIRARIQARRQRARDTGARGPFRPW